MSEIRTFLQRLLDDEDRIDDDSIVQIILNYFHINFKNLHADAIADTAPAILAAVNKDLRYIYVNQTHADFFGWKRSEIMGKMPIHILGEAAWNTARPNMERVLKGESMDYFLTVPHHSGESRELAGRYVPYRDSTGEINGVLVLALDVTERIKLEQDRHKLQETLHEASRIEAMGSLAGGIIHDINNLMSVIAVNADMLSLKAITKEEVSARFQSISDSVSRASALIEQLKEFARGEESSGSHEADLSSMTPDIVKLVRHILPRDIQLHVNIQAGCMAAIRPSRAEQILVNLILNARDAIRNKGEITVTISRTQEAEADHNGYCRILVTDTGAGIAANDLNHIFKPFFSTKRKQGGSGLGLASVKSIISVAKGHITVESEVGKGTCFEILLPAPSPTLPKPKKAEKIQDLKQYSGTESVMICDDFGAIASTSASILEMMGYQVIKATDPAVAAKHIREIGKTIDLLITDIEMPNMSGGALAKIARIVNPGMHIIFSSGLGPNNPDMEGFGDCFLQKPYSPAELLGLVRQVLDGELPAEIGS